MKGCRHCDKRLHPEVLSHLRAPVWFVGYRCPEHREPVRASDFYATREEAEDALEDGRFE